MPLPEINDLKLAWKSLPLLKLIGSTLLFTILSSGIAIGIPPLGLLIWPTKTGQSIQSALWAFLRLIPTKLSALILLLASNPSIYIAALALGMHNVGVMGRLLKEGLDSQSNHLIKSLETSGSSSRIAWLYGSMTMQTNSYLAYSAYRTDVILRETAVVGVIGGSGIGWQLIDSISSFAWGEVVLLMTIF